MNILRMRAHRRATLFVAFIAALTAMASSAAAQQRRQRRPPRQPAPAKEPAPAPAPHAPAPATAPTEPGEIELEDEKPEVNPDEIEMGEDKPGNLEADLAAEAARADAVKAGPIKRTPLSWQDIVVVVRKPFLKARRTELLPFVGTTMNDNMIRHYTLGGELAYYLTDVLAVGVEGLYYVHAFREPYDLVPRQARRLPTINEYNWSAALNFHYVPVYGKFAVLDHKLVTWEVFFTAGIGVGQSEVIPRDPQFEGFSTLLIQPNVGASMRFFVTRWMTISLGMRDYIFLDKFEPTNRSDMMFPTAAEAKERADTSLINNVMFQIGVSFWVPPTFEYTTFR
jgi:outer membrane beta-barrel protein